jgi:sterol desaturase/sphingolipid hydroxylase (fatty acid hydroxylase superfamily)
VNHLEILLVAALGLLVLFELGNVRFRRGLVRHRERLRRNIAYLVASVVVLSMVRIANDFIQAHGLALVRWTGHLGLQFLCCLLLAELVGWFQHWIKHVNGYLWNFHFQHHREEEFDVWLSAHTHALEVLVSGVLLAVLLGLAGFAPLVIEGYLVLYSFVKVFQHSANVYPLGPLDYVIAGPAYHRIHHEVGSRHNYAVTITLFDVLFGTARWPARDAAAVPAPVGVDAGERLPYGFWDEMKHFMRRRRDS